MQCDIKLEEQIANCGKYFRSIVLHTDYGKWKDRPKWHVKSNKNYCRLNGLGNTPNEAIDNFYQKLKQSRLL